MEDKNLWIRRILYAAVTVLSLVFLSFYGGNVPYMLFFAIVMNSIFMVVYILYVFFSIKIYQSLSERQVTKGEFVSYQLLLNNESFLSYRDIHLDFLRELSEVKGASQLGHMSLEPGQGIEHPMELLCKYSGTYVVGVDTVEIMDYFKILKIRFPMPQKMKVTVKPRVLYPENLSFIMKYEECHDVGQKKSSSDVIDNTVRNYVAGDNKNLIHWKNSAKKQKLMVRTMVSEEIYKYVIVMDKGIASWGLERIVQSDKLRELTLAMVHYVFRLGFQVDVFFGKRHHNEIVSYQDFEEFYAVLTEYEFGQEEDLNRFFEELNYEYEEHVPFLFITANESNDSEQKFAELKKNRNIYVLNVNTFDDIEEFLHIEERTR